MNNDHICGDNEVFISNLRKLFQAERYQFDYLFIKRLDIDNKTVIYSCQMDQSKENENPLISIDIDVFNEINSHTTDTFGYVFECLEMGSIQFKDYTYDPDLPVNEFYKTFPVPCAVASRYILDHYIKQNEIPDWILQGSSAFIEFLSKQLAEIGLPLPE